MATLYYIGNFVSINSSVYAVGLTHQMTFDAVEISQLTIDLDTVNNQIRPIGAHVTWQALPSIMTGYATDYVVMNNIVYAVVIPTPANSRSFVPGIIDVTKLTVKNTHGYFPGDLYVKWLDNTTTKEGYVQQFIVKNNIPSAVILSDVSHSRNLPLGTVRSNPITSAKYTIIPISDLKLGTNPTRMKTDAMRFISNNGQFYCIAPGSSAEGAPLKMMDISRLTVPATELVEPDITWTENNIPYQSQLHQFAVMNNKIFVISMNHSQYFATEMVKIKPIKSSW